MQLTCRARTARRPTTVTVVRKNRCVGVALMNPWPVTSTRRTIASGVRKRAVLASTDGCVTDCVVRNAFCSHEKLLKSILNTIVL